MVSRIHIYDRGVYERPPFVFLQIQAVESRINAGIDNAAELTTMAQGCASHSTCLGQKPIYHRLDGLPSKLVKLANLLDSGRTSRNFHDAFQFSEPPQKLLKLVCLLYNIIFYILYADTYYISIHVELEPNPIVGLGSTIHNFSAAPLRPGPTSVCLYIVCILV